MGNAAAMEPSNAVVGGQWSVVANGSSAQATASRAPMDCCSALACAARLPGSLRSRGPCRGGQWALRCQWQTAGRGAVWLPYRFLVACAVGPARTRQLAHAQNTAVPALRGPFCGRLVWHHAALAAHPCRSMRRRDNTREAPWLNGRYARLPPALRNGGFRR